MDISLSVIFIKVQELQIILNATQSHALIFFKKMVCLISGLKFTTGQSVWTYKNYIQVWGTHMSLSVYRGSKSLQLLA